LHDQGHVIADFAQRRQEIVTLATAKVQSAFAGNAAV
jgi:hypothetical protein